MTWVRGGQVENDAIEIRTDDLEHRFEKHGDAYRLAQVSHAAGTIRCRIVDGLLATVSSGSAWVQLHRQADGRIAAAEDDLGRKVRYRYDGRGRLVEVKDLAGESWYLEYVDDLLVAVTDPRPATIFEAAYDGARRAVRVRALANAMDFRYKDRETHATDALGPHDDVLLGRGRSHRSHHRSRRRAGRGPFRRRAPPDGTAAKRLAGRVHDLRRKRPAGDPEALGQQREVLLRRARPDRCRRRRRSLAVRFDGSGRLVSASDDAGLRSYRHAAAGWLDSVSVKSPDGATVELLHDASGAVSDVLRGGETLAIYKYRPDGRVDAIDYSGGHGATYQYEPARTSERRGLFRRRVVVDGLRRRRQPGALPAAPRQRRDHDPELRGGRVQPGAEREHRRRRRADGVVRVRRRWQAPRRPRRRSNRGGGIRRGGPGAAGDPRRRRAGVRALLRAGTGGRRERAGPAHRRSAGAGGRFGGVRPSPRHRPRPPSDGGLRPAGVPARAPDVPRFGRPSAPGRGVSLLPAQAHGAAGRRRAGPVAVRPRRAQQRPVPAAGVPGGELPAVYERHRVRGGEDGFSGLHGPPDEHHRAGKRSLPRYEWRGRELSLRRPAALVHLLRVLWRRDAPLLQAFAALSGCSVPATSTGGWVRTGSRRWCTATAPAGCSRSAPRAWTSTFSAR